MLNYLVWAIVILIIVDQVRWRRKQARKKNDVAKHRNAFPDKTKYRS